MTKPKLWSGDFTLLLFINLLGFIACQALNNGTPIYVSHAGGATGFSGAVGFVPVMFGGCAIITLALIATQILFPKEM